MEYELKVFRTSDLRDLDIGDEVTLELTGHVIGLSTDVVDVTGFKHSGGPHLMGGRQYVTFVVRDVERKA